MKKIVEILSLFILIAYPLSAQNPAATNAVPKTLFPYPVVSDTISNLEGRANVFVAKFWDNCDLSKPVSDEAAFDAAFKDYVTFFRFAHRNVVKTSISNVMNKAQSNMKNFWLLADCAERNLYSLEAVLQSDEAYMLFIENILRSSKVKKSEKVRYQKQLYKINTNQVGVAAPNLEMVDLAGNKQLLDSIQAETVLLMFNDPDCEDCSLARLRLSTNVSLNKLIDEGRIALVCIYPGEYSKEWVNAASGYSSNWIVVASEDADEKYDLRYSPTIYALDKQHTILSKSLQVEDIINLVNR